jgi:nicotinamide-nucleotide amidase
VAAVEIGIVGCSPEGLRRRASDRALSLDGLETREWDYGCRILLDAKEHALRGEDIRSAFKPFCVEPAGNPARMAVDSAKTAGMSIVLAESCTGGLAGALISEIPGCSTVFWGSMVTYANGAKERVLKVDTLKRFGAVSGPTVEAMARGALEISGAGGAASISGIAGPEGGTADKPVGTVWFAFNAGGRKSTLRCVFGGDRQRIRRQAAACALAGLANQIDGASLDIGWIAEYTFY